MSRINDPYDEVSSLDDSINSSRFVEPTSIIALATVLFYLIMSTYNSAYFSKLSIPFYSLDLPFIFYLYNGQYVALMLLLILNIVPLFINLSEKTATTGKIKFPYSNISINKNIIIKYIPTAFILVAILWGLISSLHSTSVAIIISIMLLIVFLVTIVCWTKKLNIPSTANL